MKKNCIIHQGFEKCCKTAPYEELFIDEDENCKHDKMRGSDHKNAQRDTQIFKFVSDTGELQGILKVFSVIVTIY